MYAGPSSKVMQNLYDPHINQSYRIKDHKLKLIKNKAQYKHLSECNKVPTLLTLLRILFLGQIGSISYVLPIRQNMDILNRDIRVPLLKFVWYDCLHLFWKIFVNFLTSTLLRAQNTTLLSKVRQRFFQILWPSQKTQTLTDVKMKLWRNHQLYLHLIPTLPGFNFLKF